MPIIDNQSQTLQSALRGALTTAESIDIQTAFFYFSGFKTMVEDLVDKKVRILVGLEIDSTHIPEIIQRSRDGGEDLTAYQTRAVTSSRTALRESYIDSFVGLMNYGDIFDDPEEVKAYKIFLEKIQNGSLEIKKTLIPDHAKSYITRNKKENSQNGDLPGTVFLGSSNFTYRGLKGQGELNDSYHEKSKYEEYTEQFERKWSSANAILIVDKDSSTEFIKSIEERTWYKQTPNPYLLYVRLLHELFGTEDKSLIQTPSQITGGQFKDLEYQIDAVKMGIDRLQKFDGVIVSDVVGLGKSIVASAIARNVDMETIVIAPPHLKDQWDDYAQDFGLRGARVYSSGKIGEVVERYKEHSRPLLIIIDEAHRFRNEDTDDYQRLHQLCRSHKDNKIVILTATPFNNDPKDIFALVKLFQTPGQSTIRSVDNLSMRFRELVERYKKLRNVIRTDKLSKSQIDEEAKSIALDQRRLIENIIVRRSRIDLKAIDRYWNDLQRQGISLPEVDGPKKMEYDLGGLFQLYVDTLNLIAGDNDSDGFNGARYRPSNFVIDWTQFRKALGEDFDESGIITAQQNLANFMKRLLVMRFESSIFAFQETLQKIIDSHNRIISWWDERSEVPILKKGIIPDPEDYTDEGDKEEGQLDPESPDPSGMIRVPKELIKPEFIEFVRKDLKLLMTIQQNWSQLKDEDPKIDSLLAEINKLLQDNPNRKIVVFSAYADTVEYLSKEVSNRGLNKVLKYTSKDASKSSKEIVRNNFDASIPDANQKNDYEILFTTDALSEGYNLHRAGVVINYDIPYNPTTVIQRIGRINRINKKVFDRLYIYNFFPTAVGEEEIRIHQIATLKKTLINYIIGDDTQTLNDDEELNSYYREFTQAADEKSWDAMYRNQYDLVKNDHLLIEAAMKIPPRTRIKRHDQPEEGVIVFGKKGENAIFTFAKSDEDPRVVSAEQALPIFNANEEDKSFAVDDEFLKVFDLAKEKLFAKHELPSIRGRRADAIKNLEALKGMLPKAIDHCEDVINVIKVLDDLSEGTLKDLAKLNLKNPEEAYQSLLETLPVHLIKTTMERAQRDMDERELLLFAEELSK